MQQTIIHCDRCDSTEVLHEALPQESQVTHRTMAQVKEASTRPPVTFTVYYPTTYRMVCKACGFISTYTV